MMERSYLLHIATMAMIHTVGLHGSMLTKEQVGNLLFSHSSDLSWMNRGVPIRFFFILYDSFFS